MGLRRFTSSAIIDHFALGTDELIEEMLTKELAELGHKFVGSKFTEIFATATAPVYQSFINQAEIDLLKIALGKSKLSLNEYQKKYYWTKNNYHQAQILSVKHFEREIKASRATGKNLVPELNRIQNTPKLNKSKKRELLSTYRFSPLLRTLLKISEDFTWWQDERKKATYLNIDVGTRIMNEISRRVGYDIDELKYAIPVEIGQILAEKKPSRFVLNLRKKGSVYLIARSGYVLLTGSDVDKDRKIVLGERKKDSIDDFRGLSASMGRAVGTVRVVKSATEVNKVRSGDILVAVMTRPDYVVAMRKAAAIVTNEGGITSHAAIVSRELGIPCIIGTKIATEVLKDGDLVEVNANHGWVRKLN